MARHAILKALEDARCTWKEIDLMIDCSTSLHQLIPCNGSYLQSLFLPEADGIPGMDVHGTCLGLLLGLNVANGLLAADCYRKILLVASEATLVAANWGQPESATLLGDGAAAVVVGKCDPRPGYDFRHETYSEHLEECRVRGGAHLLPAFNYAEHDDADYRFHMDGPRLFKTALKRLPALVEQLFARSSFSRDQVLCIPHQASPHAVEAVRRRLDFACERFVNRAEVLGNMAAASIPFVFDQLRREGKILVGEPLLLLGTSAGYSQAGMILTP